VGFVGGGGGILFWVGWSVFLGGGGGVVLLWGGVFWGGCRSVRGGDVGGGWVGLEGVVRGMQVATQGKPYLIQRKEVSPRDSGGLM